MRRDEVIKGLRELRSLRAKVDRLEAALDMLEEDEREIIDNFYINPVSRANDKLCEKLMVEVPTIYRRRNKALKKLEKYMA